MGMIRRLSLLTAASVLIGLVGCTQDAGTTEGTTGSASTSATDTSASPAPATETAGKMGPPGPPPAAADDFSTLPPPFKGNGKPITTPSGLKYEDMTIGNGAEAVKGKYVQVKYIGTGETGVEFDASYKRGKPFEFELGGGQVIKGWDEGIQGMKVGGRRKLIIPGPLAYGENPPPGAPFKPNETLTFDVILVGVNDSPQMPGM